MVNHKDSTFQRKFLQINLKICSLVIAQPQTDYYATLIDWYSRTKYNQYYRTINYMLKTQ
jgi:hypothetical protein